MSIATEALNWEPAVGGSLREAFWGSPSGKRERSSGCRAAHMACERSRNRRSLFFSMKPVTL